MTKQDFYLALCKEAGTHDGISDANTWYTLCDKACNITPGMDHDFALAATGHVQSILSARASVGLPALI